MCDKCETPVVPALLAKYLEVKNTGKGTIAYYVHQQIQVNMRPASRVHWDNNDFYYIKLRPSQLQEGHAIGKSRAIVNKQANRTPVTPLEFQPVIDYFGVLRLAHGNAIRKAEPSLNTAWEKLNDGTWERLTMANLAPDMTSIHVSFDMMNRLHLLHVSTDNPSQVAYYPSLRHMREGREVRTKIGKYLTTYREMLGLSEVGVKDIAEKYASNIASRNGWEVRFIEKDDPDGWVRTYQSDKVTSCMAGDKSVRVYANEHSTLRLAYVFDGNDVIARCIVRDGGDDESDNTGYLRVYPDANGYAEGRFLLDYLKNNGYENNINLDGVILQAIDTGNSTYVCPYLDSGSGGDQSVGTTRINGTQFLRVGDGEYQACNTNGETESDNTSECDECGENYHEDDTTYVESTGRSVCSCCLDNDYTYAYGAHGREYYPENDCVYVGDDYYFVETIHEHDIYQCEVSGEWLHSDDMVSTSRGMVDSSICVELDHNDTDGNIYVYERDVAELSDGTKCHEDDVERLQAELDFNNGEL